MRREGIGNPHFTSSTLFSTLHAPERFQRRLLDVGITFVQIGITLRCYWSLEGKWTDGQGVDCWPLAVLPLAHCTKNKTLLLHKQLREAVKTSIWFACLL